MKMVNIMNYKVLIYVLMLFVSIFALSGINFMGFFKIKHELEAKIFVMLASFGLAYVSAEFFIKLIELF